MRAFALVLGAWIAGASFAGEEVRLDGVWNFGFAEGRSIEQAFTAGFETPDRMVVPGCFDMMPQWLMKKGTGLYRRTFALKSPLKAAVLRIEGLGLRGAFRLDGRDIGVDELPWSTLELPVGPLAAGEHTLEAAVDNRVDPKTNRLFFPEYDFYSFGGFFHGLVLAEREPKVFVRTCDYRTGEVEVEVEGEGRKLVRVPNFKLWSPEEPNLTTLEVAGRKVRFGIREIKAENGRLFLNGKPLFLKGVNRHESHPDQGAATSEDLMLKDLQLLKSLGGNFVRGAHYPQTRRFLDLCDELGVLVWEESLGWGNYAASKWDPSRAELRDPEFRRLQLEQTKLMVRNSFNHPSVILFGFLNECQSSHPDCAAFVGELAAAIRSFDSGRLVTFAINRNPVEGAQEADAAAVHCDVVSFNTYPAWISSGGPGEAEAMRKEILDGPHGVNAVVAAYRKLYPKKPILVSEMGTCGVYGQRDPAAAQWTEEFQAEYFADVLEGCLGNPDLSGVALWQFTDARSYHRVGPVRVKPFARNLAGIFDGYRRPKLAAKVVADKFKSSRAVAK